MATNCGVAARAEPPGGCALRDNRTGQARRRVYTVHSDVYNVRMSKDKIFAAAKFVLDREGLPGLTIRKVAQHARLSPMALYRHFADKDALLNSLMEDGLAAWEERVRSIRAADPIEWLEALGAEFLDFALKEPHRFDAAFFLPAPKARQYPDDFAAGRSRSWQWP